MRPGDTHANAAVVLDEDIFLKAGYYHGPRGLEVGAALALNDPGIRQLNQLAKVKGIGVTTLERAFADARTVHLCDMAG